jgi:PAS domain S-box-containing protein
MALQEKFISDTEYQRLNALESYHILDTLPEKEYDAITRLASYICKVPISLISFIDLDRQWFKSRIGMDREETLRSDAFCNHTILNDNILEINDTLKSDVFKDNALVQGNPHIRFYAGAPLIDPEGHRLGALCVIDRVPRELNDEQRDALRILASEVMAHIVLRKEKQQAEASLTKHEEFFNLFNNSGEVHCITDRDFNIELINNAVYKTLGYKPEELIGLPIWNFFLQESKSASLEVLRKGIKSQKRSFDIETLVVTKSGKIRCMSWSVSHSHDKWYTSGRDITEQKEIAAQLEQLSLVASSTTSGVVINNKHGMVEWISSAFENITGYSLEDVQNKHLGDVLKGELTDVAVIEQARQLSKNKQSFEVDLQVYRKDGKPLWISVINSVILSDKNEVEKYIEVIIDITDKKQAELQLVDAKEEAQQLSKAKDMFISVLGHEIRTPLNAVIGMSRLLQEEKHLESQIENLDVLKFSAENLMNLINDVLDFTKIETGNIELESAEVNLRELIESIIKSMQFRVSDKNIYLKGSIDKTVPEIVMGDRTRICQILLNLAGNSVKFTEEGGITIDLKVIEQTQNKATIRFAVNDTGIGIAADKIETIFESFKQAEADTTRKYGGTGLGLAITKKLVEIHGSKINVDSTPGKGSSFWFTVKFNKGQIQGNTYTNNNTVETELLLNVNVLVVDDNQINRLLINKVLSKWGATIDFAENGLEAVAKIEGKADFDVVLMDIHMPVMGGLEATEIIRSKGETYFQQLPIIALTASMLNSEVNEIVRAGMNDYILKPFDPKGLYDKLTKYQKVSRD